MATSFPINRDHPPRRLIYRANEGTLVLRPWCLDDVAPQVEAIEASRADLRGFMPWAHGPVTRETQYQVITRMQAEYFSGKDLALGIFSPDSEVLGGVGLHPRTPLNPRALEVGYWGHSAHTGRGNVTCAVRMLIALAFDFFGVDRLQVMHDEANVASRRVVEKCGFVFEGVMRNVTLAPTPELVASGLRVSGRNRMYALCLEDLESLAWLEKTRSNLEVEDALGERRRWPEVAKS